jgi:NitT/TauT family transport system permease protein
MTKTTYYYHHKSGRLSHHSSKLTVFLTLSFIPILILSYLFIDSTYDLLEKYSIQDFILIYNQIPFKLLFIASLLTVFRISIAYIFSFITALSLSLLVTLSPGVSKILLPIYDVLESIPILAFFPIIIIFFIKYNFLEGAAIFVIFMAILWNLVFTMVGGLQLIPKDIIDTAKLNGVKGFKYLKHVLLPAITPEIVTGSILAIAAAWDIVIVAEVLHTYIPNGNSSIDLLGLGSLFVNATTESNKIIFTTSLFFMILIITLTNIFIWQKLLKYSEKFRFE